MGQERVSQILRSQRRLENRVRVLDTPPPPKTDKAATLQWLFVMAKRDHLAALARRQEQERLDARAKAAEGG